VLSANHPDIATSLHDLAKAYDARGLGEEAAALYARAAAIREERIRTDAATAGT
jgi:hypothetical protein